jgi:hypothetical protein
MLTSEKFSMHNIPAAVYRIYKSKFETPDLSEGVCEIIKIDPFVSNDLFYLY